MSDSNRERVETKAYEQPAGNCFGTYEANAAGRVAPGPSAQYEIWDNYLNIIAAR